jgi:hypothetical protein
MAKRFPYEDKITLADINDIITGNVDFKVNRAWGIAGVLVNHFRGHPEDAAPTLKAVSLDGLSEAEVDAADPITLAELQAHLAAAPEGAATLVNPLELFTWARILATLKREWPAIYGVIRELIEALLKGD